jgi:PAS domain S-box-containing protein
MHWMKLNVFRRLLISLALASLVSTVVYFLIAQPSSYSSMLAFVCSLLSGFTLLYLFVSRVLLKPLSRFSSQAEEAISADTSLDMASTGLNELEPVAQLIRYQENVISHAVQAISALNKQEDQDKPPISIEHQALTSALSQVKLEMQQIARQEQQRNWATQGLARFVDILRSNNQDIRLLGDAIISELVNYLKANQGGLFILGRDESGQDCLELIACYAYERKKYLEKKVEIGEGLLGQAYLEKEYIYLTDVPPQYISITSGLGKATPRSLLLVPLVLNKEVFGVIELASFYKFEKYQIEFLNKLGESIASTIANVKAGEHNRRLLEDSQIQAEQLRAQEEEVRQNMEELQATQEEMQRTQRENHKMMEELEHVKVKLQQELKAKITEIENEKARTDIFLSTTQDAILYLDENLKITYINRGGEKMFSYQPGQLQDKSLATVIQSDCPESELLQNYMNKAQQMGNTCEYTGKSNMYGFTFPVSIAITEGQVNGQKVYTAIIRNVQKQKEQENRMQKAVNSAKEVHDRLMEREQQFKEIEQELGRIRQQLEEKEKTIAQLEAGRN